MSNFLYNTSSLASTYILAAFTIEVYIAIVHPVFHKNHFHHKLVAVMVVGAWIIGVSYCMGMSMGIARVINGICYVTLGWPPIALGGGFAAFLLRMGVPILCYGVCYVLIFASLKSRAKIAAQTVATKTSTKKRGEMKIHPQTSSLPTATPTAASASQKQFSRASQNVVTTVLYTTVIHVVTWTGNQVLIFMTAFGYVTDFQAPTFQVLLLATYCNSCVNPFVYIVKYREFRRAVKRIMFFCKSIKSINSGIMLGLRRSSNRVTATGTATT